MISYLSQEIALPSLRRRAVSRWLRAVAATYGRTVGNLTYIFCNDEKILEVNREFLHHDYYTDIITFDDTEGTTLHGDIFISLDTVESNSRQFATAYEDELLRVIVHGVLHLCGINDKGPGERQQMERAEDGALALCDKAAIWGRK